MNNSKLGIPVNYLAAISYIMCYFQNYVVLLLLIGYILLKEDNVWLKKTAFKGFLLALVFSCATSIIGVITSIIPLAAIVFTIIKLILSILKAVLFFVLAFEGVKQKSISIPFIDNLVDKCISE